MKFSDCKLFQISLARYTHTHTHTKSESLVRVYSSPSNASLISAISFFLSLFFLFLFFLNAATRSVQRLSDLRNRKRRAPWSLFFPLFFPFFFDLRNTKRRAPRSLWHTYIHTHTHTQYPHTLAHTHTHTHTRYPHTIHTLTLLLSLARV
jgi:hypothetical protein